MPFLRRNAKLISGAALAAATLFSAGTVPAESASSPRPNIIFILADDLGYGDIGCYGQKQIRTPEIDRMAAEGIRFTDCYAGSAVCAPSRATLLTGFHTGHTRIRANKNSVMRPEDLTVAEVLQKAGYRTALFGKWGLSKDDGGSAPEKNGFDESLAYLTHTQAHDYTPETLWKNGQKIPLEPGTYTPDLITSAALEFVSRKHEKPYFLYLATTIPHAHNKLGKETGNGMEVPSDAPYSDRDWPQPQKNHAAMITRMDSQVGQLLARLRETGQDKNTVVFFSSDNGPHKEGGAKPNFFDSNGPLKGIKRDLYDGGIRVPMIAWWPGTAKPAVSEKIWAFWDFLPTAAELAGTKVEGKLDGISLAGLLQGKSSPDHEYLYWELQDGSALGSYPGPQKALRIGQWKAILRGEGTELYNLSSDPGEEKNVAAEHPEMVEKANALFVSARTVPEDELTSGAAAEKKPRRRAAPNAQSTSTEE